MFLSRTPIAIVSLILLGIGQAPASAQTSAPDRAAAIQPLLDPASAGSGFNGVVLATDGEAVVIRQALGLARFATGEPLSADSVFQTASAAKPFTATAVLQLRDAGRLGLEDAVADHLPGFPWPDIHIRHLLNHTSGLPDLEVFEDLVAREPGKVITGRDLIPALQAWDRALSGSPGEAFHYSNVNYQLLALIVEQVSGRPFALYMREHVFDPAGMRSTWVLGDPAAATLPTPVANHVQAVMFRETPEDVATLSLADERAMRPFRYEGYNLGSTVGDQNLFTTVDDLRRFDDALRQGRVLDPASQSQAYTPTRLNDGAQYLDADVYQIYQTRCSYGLGWEVCDHPAFGRIVGHSGYNRGIATLFYRNLDRGQMIAMFDNGGGEAFASRAASVANVLNGAPALLVSTQRSLTRAFGARLVERGMPQALIFFNAHRAETTDWVYTARGLNRLGYDLLHNGHPALAEQVFRLNVTLQPDQATWYDSWADGLGGLGRTDEAIAAYRRALELDPDATQTAAKLQALTDAVGEAHARE